MKFLKFKALIFKTSLGRLKILNLHLRVDITFDTKRTLWTWTRSQELQKAKKLGVLVYVKTTLIMIRAGWVMLVVVIVLAFITVGCQNIPYGAPSWTEWKTHSCPCVQIWWAASHICLPDVCLVLVGLLSCSQINSSSHSYTTGIPSFMIEFSSLEVCYHSG